MGSIDWDNLTDIQLLEFIDEGLRHGSMMTRANLAFDYLLGRLGLSRMDLPEYALEREMEE